MRALPAAGIWLESALALHSCLQESERSNPGNRNRSERVPRVSIGQPYGDYGFGGFVLKSASFAQRDGCEILRKHMLVRSVTRVFHTCGKNCGNSLRNNTIAQFPGGFTAIPAQLRKRRFAEVPSGLI